MNSLHELCKHITYVVHCFQALYTALFYFVNSVRGAPLRCISYTTVTHTITVSCLILSITLGCIS